MSQEKPTEAPPAESGVSTFASRRLYQRLIPMFIMSAMAVVLIIQYFLPYIGTTKTTVLDGARTDLLAINSTVMSMTQLFGIVTLLLWRTRNAVRRVGNKKNVFSSMMFMVWYVLFLAIIFIADPVKLTGGQFYTLWFQATLGILTTSATGIKFLHHSFWTFRLFASVATYESATLFIVWLITFLRNMSLAVFLVPPIAFLGDWVEVYAFAAASRALLLSTAVGACIIAARAIVGREPGLIDMEMV